MIKVFFKTHIKTAIQAALNAGESILEIYRRDFTVEYKDDRSPLTEADQAAHRIICTALATTGLPVLSEESGQILYEARRNWQRFWLVDPLDGTKEFIKKNGEFTVNIALIDNGRPVLGVVYVPVLQTIYCGMLEVGSEMSTVGVAWKATDCNGKTADEILGSSISLSTSHIPQSTTRCEAPLRVVASRSHCNEETCAFIQALEDQFGTAERVSSGSSLKLCMVAEGIADIYPRIAPTMEWDTAAAQAVVEAAGGRVFQYDPDVPAPLYLDGGAGGLKDLLYNKENLLNPFFVAVGRRVE